MQFTGNTMYRLATDADNAALAEMPVDLSLCKFPTVVAERDGEILGMLSTLPHEEQIVAGQMYVKPGRNRSVVAIRLGQAYESLMQSIGVTQYRFCVDEGNRWADACRESGRFVYEGIFEGQHIFKRVMQ